MDKNKKMMWTGIIIAIVLLIGGFYLYYYYPKSMPGMASISPKLEKDLNILVVGLDDVESVEKGEIEADSLVLVKLRASEKELSFSLIPSDTKINEVAIKSLPVEELLEKINEVEGVKADYHFVISYNGFIKIIDELGGIDIKLDEALKVADLDINLKEGSNHLTGKEALNFSRFYDYKKDEIDRLERQQMVIKGLVKEGLKAETILKVPRLFSLVLETFEDTSTNIDFSLVSEVIEFLNNLDDLNINYSIMNFDN
jgi:polyisoprenyl-teichoic acid--peptidoglycan teichoic acid transferase